MTKLSNKAQPIPKLKPPTRKIDLLKKMEAEIAPSTSSPKIMIK